MGLGTSFDYQKKMGYLPPSLSLSIYIYEIVDYEMYLRECGLHLDVLYMVR
jgi:hypothetical protein